MPKKCPPGVICIENVTMFFLVIVILIIIYLIYISFIKRENKQKVIVNVDKQNDPSYIISQQPNYPYNNIPVNDVLMNPYVPPLRDERYFIPEVVPIRRGAVPINVSTNPGAVDTNYRQMGILTPLHNNSKKDKILPLMGRPLLVNRDKWQYYTMSDQNNSVKLPIIHKGRSCTNEYGCDQLYNGDRVFVEGYNQAFKITIYENDVIKYIPYL
jgi:hypothetical protein|uniref:Uncharacterized protein n=1 Tax=viral metagenome TaxID=1070528 RepID=A0A6C0CVQ2_9ZZZZ